MLEEMRLQKYIASAGVCSRRAAEEYIKNGRVKVNGKLVCELGVKVTAKDTVLVDNKKIEIEENKIYLMLNKPHGYITTMSDEKNRRCIKDLIHEKERVFPLGRLDRDTTGLLILTNDGDFANKVMHPSKEIYKTYIAKIDKEIKLEDLEKLENGVDIGDFITSKAKIKEINSKTIEVKICEGKNRQVRRMFSALGYEVLKLHRSKVGNLELGNLQIGKYVKLTEKDIKKIFN